MEYKYGIHGFAEIGAAEKGFVWICRIEVFGFTNIFLKNKCR